MEVEPTTTTSTSDDIKQRINSDVAFKAYTVFDYRNTCKESSLETFKTLVMLKLITSM